MPNELDPEVDANLQSAMQEDTAPPTAATQPSGVVDVIVCRACGFVNDGSAGLCGRPSCRKFLPRNRVSVKTNLNVTHLTPELQTFEDEGRALFEQSVTDAGGREALTARVIAEHAYRAVLHVRIRKLERAFEKLGDFDKRGRLRAGWIKELVSLVSTALSIDRTLGLDRQARQVNFTERLAAALEAKRASAEDPR